MGDGELTILGGGPAGLALAFYAQRAGLPFALYERAAEPGGLCRTFRWDGHAYDAGAHRFHDSDAGVTADVQTLLGDALATVEAPSQILAGGRFIDFPPTPINWLLGQGVAEAGRVALDLWRARRHPRPERTFEDHALNRYGRRLGKPLLLDYSEKLWGLPAAQLAPEVATRRLSGLSLGALVVELLRPNRKRAHLDGSFLYPRDGYGAIAAAMTATLPPARLHLRHEITGLVCVRRRVRAIVLADGTERAVAGRLVSTLPLSLLVRFLGNALPPEVHRATARLRFRHVRIVYLRLGTSHVSRNATVYLPDPALCVSRVSEPKNRSAAMAPAGETGLVAEVPCSTGDPLHTLSDEALAARVVDELSASGLIRRDVVRGWRHHLLANAYPVYGLDWSATVEYVRAAVATIENVGLLGRGGLFWYSHLHDQMRLAKDWVASATAAQQVAAHAQIGGDAVPAAVGS